MMKREEDENEHEDVPLNFYVVQSPLSSISSSTCPHYSHHHHPKLTPKPFPTINPLDHHHDDDDDDDDDDNVVSFSTYKNNTTTINISNNTSLEMSRCCSSRASLTSISLDNDSVGKHSLLTNTKKLDVIAPPTYPIPTNHDNDEGSVLLLNANNNETHSSSEKFGECWYQYHHQINMKEDNGDDDDKCCCKYLSMKTYPTSNLWIGLQIIWRLLFSLSVALLVFYLATKPPPPYLSLQAGGVKEFELREGVDNSGVETNFLSCNISILVLIDNKSKLFSLHLHPLRTSLYYGRIPLVQSHQQLLEEDVKKVKNEEKKEIRISVGVRGMAMYGAGREMQDALGGGGGGDDKSNNGNNGGRLDLAATLWVHSYYKIIPNLIHPNFHHKAYCIFSIHNNNFNHHQALNTSCRYSLS